MTDPAVPENPSNPRSADGLEAQARSGRDDGRAGPRLRLRGWLLAAIGVLYAASVPWYREPGAAGAEPDLWLGLPVWVAGALLCYVLAAVLNACVWLLADVPDEPRRDAHGELGGRPR